VGRRNGAAPKSLLTTSHRPRFSRGCFRRAPEEEARIDERFCELALASLGRAPAPLLLTAEETLSRALDATDELAFRSLRRCRREPLSRSQDAAEESLSRAPEAAEETLSRAPDAAEEATSSRPQQLPERKRAPSAYTARRTLNQKVPFGAPEIRREAEGGCNMVYKDA
jgi:hypothetical protein